MPNYGRLAAVIIAPDLPMEACFPAINLMSFEERYYKFDYQLIKFMFNCQPITPGGGFNPLKMLSSQPVFQ
jgi:hypothetical protein